jgi:hypothetical protein
MNTTLLFAELLIIGLQGSLWIFLLVLNIFGYRWLQGLHSTGLSEWQAVLIALLLSFVYVLGIIIDRLADLIFSRQNKSIGEKIIPNAPFPVSVMRFTMGKDNEYLNRQFEYTRSRMRIARASSLNFGLSTILAATFILLRLQNLNSMEKWVCFFFVLLTGIFLTAATVYTWNKLMRTYFELVKSNYEFYISKQTPAATTLALSQVNTVEMVARTNSGDEHEMMD